MTEESYGAGIAELMNPEIARNQIDRIVRSLQDIAIVEQGPMMEGRAMFAVLARSRAAQAAAERAREARPAENRTQAPAPAPVAAPASAPATAGSENRLS